MINNPELNLNPLLLNDINELLKSLEPNKPDAIVE